MPRSFWPRNKNRRRTCHWSSHRVVTWRCSLPLRPCFVAASPAALRRGGVSGSALQHHQSREYISAWSLLVRENVVVASPGNLACSLVEARAFDKAIPFLREQVLVANRAFGPDHVRVLDLAAYLSEALRVNPDATRDDIVESESIYLNVLQRQRRVLGPAHPYTKNSEQVLSFVRKKLDKA